MKNFLAIFVITLLFFNNYNCSSTFKTSSKLTNPNHEKKINEIFFKKENFKDALGKIDLDVSANSNTSKSMSLIKEHKELNTHNDKDIKDLKSSTSIQQIIPRVLDIKPIKAKTIAEFDEKLDKVMIDMLNKQKKAWYPGRKKELFEELKDKEKYVDPIIVKSLTAKSREEIEKNSSVEIVNYRAKNEKQEGINAKNLNDFNNNYLTKVLSTDQLLNGSNSRLQESSRTEKSNKLAEKINIEKRMKKINFKLKKKINKNQEINSKNQVKNINQKSNNKSFSQVNSINSKDNLSSSKQVQQNKTFNNPTKNTINKVNKNNKVSETASLNSSISTNKNPGVKILKNNKFTAPTNLPLSSTKNENLNPDKKITLRESKKFNPDLNTNTTSNYSNENNKKLIVKNDIENTNTAKANSDKYNQINRKAIKNMSIKKLRKKTLPKEIKAGKLHENEHQQEKELDLDNKYYLNNSQGSNNYNKPKLIDSTSLLSKRKLHKQALKAFRKLMKSYVEMNDLVEQYLYF